MSHTLALRSALAGAAISALVFGGASLAAENPFLGEPIFDLQKPFFQSQTRPGHWLPTITVAKDGSILVFRDRREKGVIVVHRSEDGGKGWRIAWSEDGGESWGEASESKALPDGPPGRLRLQGGVDPPAAGRQGPPRLQLPKGPHGQNPRRHRTAGQFRWCPDLAGEAGRHRRPGQLYLAGRRTPRHAQ